MIRFFTEDISFTLPQKQPTRQWLTALAAQAGFTVGELNYIFCSDEYLLQVNREYLEHDYYTDIITFDNSEEDDRLEGDIFVSIDRIRDNAQQVGVTEEQELRRVLAHGICICVVTATKRKKKQSGCGKRRKSLTAWSNLPRKAVKGAAGQ